MTFSATVIGSTSEKCCVTMPIPCRIASFGARISVGAPPTRISPASGAASPYNPRIGTAARPPGPPSSAVLAAGNDPAGRLPLGDVDAEQAVLDRLLLLLHQADDIVRDAAVDARVQRGEARAP